MTRRDSKHPDQPSIEERLQDAINAPRPGCPDPLDLAAFVDGSLRGPQASNVRSHVDRCEECQAAVNDCLAISPDSVESHLVSSDQAIVRAMLREEFGASRAVIQVIRREGVRRFAALAAAAAAVVGVSLAGYYLGRSAVPPPSVPGAAGESLVDGSSSEADFMSLASFGLLSDDEFDAAISVDLSQLTLGEVTP